MLLVHGDDDRNVAFQQTTGLVQLLRQRDVYYELIVFPDDTHESMLHSRWMYTLGRMETFFEQVPRAGGATATKITTGLKCAMAECDHARSAASLTPRPHVVRTTLPMFCRLWMNRCASAARSSGKVRATTGAEAAGLQLAEQHVHQRRELALRSSHRCPTFRPKTPRLRLISESGSNRGVAIQARKARHRLRCLARAPRPRART